MTAKGLPTADLSDAFGKPASRAANLRMPAKRTHTPRTTPVQVVPAPEGPAETAERPTGTAGPTTAVEGHRSPPSAATGSPEPAARSRRGRPPKAASAQQASTGQPSAGKGCLVLWTPLPIRARMQAVRANQGRLYLDQVLDALEATYDQLADLISQSTTSTRTQGRLFERTSLPLTEPAERKVQLTIRGVLDSQLRVIDDLVEQTGAPSRSALVNTALDATLPPG